MFKNFWKISKSWKINETIFKREGVTNFTIEAARGEVFMLTDEKEPEVIRKYSIYGEN